MMPTGPAILVADDHDTVRQMLRIALGNIGFSVELAADGEVAVDLYQRERFDLVLLDVRMPVMNGPEALAILQKIDPEIRCCFMTSDAGDHSTEELLAMGALAVISKPFVIAELVDTLRQVLGHARP